MAQCPGQDMRYWKPGDIYDAPCPKCGAAVEFFKDDAVRICRNCGTQAANPRRNPACAAWCVRAKECLAGKKAIERKFA